MLLPQRLYNTFLQIFRAAKLNIGSVAETNAIREECNNLKTVIEDIAREQAEKTCEALQTQVTQGFNNIAKHIEEVEHSIATAPKKAPKKKAPVEPPKDQLINESTD